MDKEQLDKIADDIRNDFEEMGAARELAFQRSRPLIGVCARAIRAIHRDEWDVAEAVKITKSGLSPHFPPESKERARDALSWCHLPTMCV